MVWGINLSGKGRPQQSIILSLPFGWEKRGMKSRSKPKVQRQRLRCRWPICGRAAFKSRKSRSSWSLKNFVNSIFEGRAKSGCCRIPCCEWESGNRCGHSKFQGRIEGRVGQANDHLRQPPPQQFEASSGASEDLP